MLLQEKQKKKKKENGQKDIKVVFFKVVIQKWEKWKNRFLAKIAWHYLCQEGRTKTRILVDTICFGQQCFWDQNSENQEKL